MRFKWFISRSLLLWRFFKLLPYARTLEIDVQKAKQTRDDMAFAGDEKKYIYWQGYVDGINFALGVTKRG